MLVLFALSFALELIPTQLLAKVGGKSEADKESAKRDKNILTCILQNFHQPGRVGKG